MDLYCLDTGQHPSNDACQQALIGQPAGRIGWRRPYLRKGLGLTDPWGRELVYRAPGEHDAYDLCSLERDGALEGEGENKDVVSW